MAKTSNSKRNLANSRSKSVALLKDFRNSTKGNKKYINVDALKQELKKYSKVNGILSICHTRAFGLRVSAVGAVLVMTSGGRTRLT